MSKGVINKPFFVFNPKSYLYGNELLDLVVLADELASKSNISIFVTAPYSDLKLVSENTEHVIITAQHMDGISPGRGMGHVLPESLYEAGARATVLNHAEHPMTLNELVQSMNKAKELGMVTIVCADSLAEATAIAKLNPEILLCEPTELIGTGQTSDENYIRQTNEAIKNVNNSILVMQAAGISTDDDVYRTISLGADGTGATSGIVKADNPRQALKDMIQAVVRASQSSDVKE